MKDGADAAAAEGAELIRLRAARIRRRLAEPGARLAPIGGGYALRLPAGRRGGGELRIDPATFAAVARGGALTGDEICGYRLARTAPPLTEPDAAGPQQGPDPRPGRRATAVDWLAARTDPSGRPWLAASEIRAARRLERDHEIAVQGGARLTQTWTAAPRGSPTARGDHDGVLAALRARSRLAAALAATGPAASAVLTVVCLQALGLEQAAARLHLARGVVRSRLREGLTRLARHYGC